METTMPARNVEQEFDALKLDFAKLGTDLMGLTEAMRGLTTTEVQEHLAKLRAVMGHANDDVEAAALALSARGRKGVAVAAQCIGERPLTSILVCFGLGVVIGKLFDR